MMRRVAFISEATQSLRAQIDFLLDCHAIADAESLRDRVAFFLSKTLAHYPASGRHLESPDIWEAWIPQTRLVVWYRFSDDELYVVAFWHTSQDRHLL